MNEVSKPPAMWPAHPHRVMVTLEGDTIHLAGKDKDLTRRVANLLVRGNPEVKDRSSGVLISGPFPGTSHTTGTVILSSYEDGTAKVALYGHTAPELVVQCAGLVFEAGTMNPVDNGAVTYKGKLLKAPVMEVISGTAAKSALGQKVTIKPLAYGKVRIIGLKADCEAMKTLIIKGNAAEASGEGKNFKLEGDLLPAAREKSAPEADKNGVVIQDSPSERTFSAFGENLVAVKAALEQGCVPETPSTKRTIFVIEGTSQSGPRVVGFGKRKT